MRIKKKPDHWPATSPKQQIEGLKFIVKQINITDFEWSLKLLTWNKYMSKSKMASLLRRYRKIANISYNQWRKDK